jgi:hypothetical protein
MTRAWFAMALMAMVCGCAAGARPAASTPNLAVRTGVESPVTPSAIPTAEAAWVHYHDSRFDFDYPSAWIAQHHEFYCSFCAIEVELSQVDTPDPCVTLGNATECNATRGVTLAPGAVFAVWWHWGMVGPGVNRGVGVPMLVGGREAIFRKGRASQDCTNVSDHSLDVQVVSPFLYNWEEFHACYAASDASQIEPSLQRMLASVRWNDQ